MNMSKRKILAGLLVAVLIMTVFSACSKKETAKEMLEKSIERSMETKSVKQTFDMGVSFDPGMTEEEKAQDPMSGGLVEMIDSMNVSGEFASDTESGISGGNVLIDMKGMQFNLEVYADSMGGVFIKMPMSDKYITVNTTGEIPSEEEIEEMKTFSKEIATSLIAGFSEENMIIEDKSVELSDGTYDLNEITVTLDDAEAKELIKSLIPEIYSNGTMRKSLETNVRMQWEMEGKNIKDMDIEAEIDSLVEKASKAFDEAEGVFTIDEFVMVFGIDKDYNTRETNVNMAYSVTDETTEKPVKMGFEFTSETYGIDEPVSIDMPAVNEENSITMEDFVMQTMFGGMQQIQPMPESGASQK
ncbi:MAG: hypothetical protein JJE29_01620 [Peptostreptococcaceae bacterium]|nr:hypothetical protein [Peptostreptococcaceae bacterium]